MAEGTNKLVLVYFNPPQEYVIMKLDAGSEEPQAVISFKNEVISPSWSSNGETIVFIKPGDGIFSVSTTGDDLTLIPNSEGWNDSNAIIAQANPSGDNIIYVDEQNIDGRYIYKLRSINMEGGHPATLMDPIQIENQSISYSNSITCIVYTCYKTI